jgi:hypothetical protein
MDRVTFAIRVKPDFDPADVLDFAEILATIKQGKTLILTCEGEYEDADKLIAKFPL